MRLLHKLLRVLLKSIEAESSAIFRLVSSPLPQARYHCLMPSYFDAAYQGSPPWDIGKPQAEFVRLEQAGEIKGDVLDIGCGTGENALYLAQAGHEVWGIDLVPLAIEKAKAKAVERALKATFLVWNALELAGLKRSFDTAIDSGLYHSLPVSEHSRFLGSLRSALRPEGTYFMMCFSDRQPGTLGPRRISQEEIRATFTARWRINYIRQAYFESNLEGKAQAWLSSITRLG